MKGKQDSGSKDGEIPRSRFDAKMQAVKRVGLFVKRGIFRIETARKITQFSCFLLFNAAIFGLGPWPMLLPVLQSLGTPHKTVGGAFGALQLMLFEVVFPWIPLASILLTVVVAGRSLCGWACPFGFAQDLLSYIKGKNMRVSLRTHREMVNLKYVVLMVTLFISGTLAMTQAAGVGQNYRESLGTFAPAPFDALSPADTLFAVFPRLMWNIRYGVPVLLEKATWEAPGALFAGLLSVSPLLWVRLAVMIGVMVLVVYVPRGWCRYLCPQGALLALLGWFGFLGLKRDPLKCTRVGCRLCVEECPMMVRILDLPWRKFADPECIFCLKCVDVCPSGALGVKFP